jgi:hypothetical protein
MYGIQAFGIIADPADPKWFASARRIEAAVRGEELDALDLEHVGVVVESTIEPTESTRCYIGHASWDPFLTEIKHQYSRHAWVIVSGGFEPTIDERIRPYFGLSRRRIIAFPNAEGGEEHFRPWIRRWAEMGLLPATIRATEVSLVSGRQNVRQYVAGTVMKALAALMILVTGVDEALRLRTEAGLPLDEETTEAICTLLDDGIRDVALEKEIYTIGALFRPDRSAAARRIALACRFVGMYHPAFQIRGESLEKLLKTLREADDVAFQPAVRSMYSHLREVIDVFAALERGEPEFAACFVTAAQAGKELAGGPFPSEYGCGIVRDLAAEALPGFSGELWVGHVMRRGSLTASELQRVVGDLRVLIFLSETKLLPWRRSEAGHDTLSNHRFTIDGFLELALLEGDEEFGGVLRAQGSLIVEDAARVENFISEVLEAFGFELSESLTTRIAEARQALSELRKYGFRLAAGEITKELHDGFVQSSRIAMSVLDATSQQHINEFILGLDSRLICERARALIKRAFGDGGSEGDARFHKSIHH